MIRIIIFFILIFCTICAQAQSKRLVEISKEYYTKDIPVTDGMVYKYIVGEQNDTARYYQPGADIYEATITFRKIGGTTPLIITIEAEGMTVLNATKTGSYVEHIQTTSVLSTPITVSRNKILVNYSRGDQGSGAVQLRTTPTGPIIASIDLPFTGGWTTFKETPWIDVSIPVGTLYMTFPVKGAANFNSFKVQ